MNRFLLVSPFPPYIGGVSVSSQRLYDNLKKDGIQVYKYDIKYANKKLNKFKILKSTKFLLLPFFLLFNKRFDVIHFHVSGSYLRLYVSIFRIFFSKKTKFISTIHGDVKVLLDEQFGKLCLIGFDKIICVKKGDGNILKNHFKGSIVEIPAFIKPVVDLSTKLPVKLLYFLDKSSVKIVVNGSLICDEIYHDLYGFKDALELIKKLRDSGENVKLLLINLGNRSGHRGEKYIEDLKNYIQINELNEFIFFYEGEPLDFQLVLKKVDIFIRPTKTDGDAMSIREALLNKTPTIASDVIERPYGTNIYKHGDILDLYNETIGLIDNYQFHKNLLSRTQKDFYQKIRMEYED